jgi:hypothetical protein
VSMKTTFMAGWAHGGIVHGGMGQWGVVSQPRRNLSTSHPILASTSHNPYLALSPFPPGS